MEEVWALTPRALNFWVRNSAEVQVEGFHLYIVMLHHVDGGLSLPAAEVEDYLTLLQVHGAQHPDGQVQTFAAEEVTVDVIAGVAVQFGISSLLRGAESGQYFLDFFV
jgi:hypothetical protein